MTRPVCLTVAGADPTGGAGLAADLRTFSACGVHGAFALTAVTAQTTAELRVVRPVEPADVVAQVEAVLEDLRPRAVKVGFVPTAATLRAVLAALPDETVIVADPVLVDRTGRALFDDEVIDAWRAVVGRAAVVTPNRHEARLLADARPDVDDGLAATLVGLGARAAVVTRAHEHEDEVVDVFRVGSEERRRAAPRLDTTTTRGSGDTLSAFLTAGLAHGRELSPLLDEAAAFTARAIAAGLPVGAGTGPVDQDVDRAEAVSS